MWLSHPCVTVPCIPHTSLHKISCVFYSGPLFYHCIPLIFMCFLDSCVFYSTVPNRPLIFLWRWQASWKIKGPLQIDLVWKLVGFLVSDIVTRWLHMCRCIRIRCGKRTKGSVVVVIWLEGSIGDEVKVMDDTRDHRILYHHRLNHLHYY